MTETNLHRNGLYSVSDITVYMKGVYITHSECIFISLWKSFYMTNMTYYFCQHAKWPGFSPLIKCLSDYNTFCLDITYVFQSSPFIWYLFFILEMDNYYVQLIYKPKMQQQIREHSNITKNTTPNLSRTSAHKIISTK